jgi:hypothetical protein
MSSYKKLTWKGTSRPVFIRVERLENSQSFGYFRPIFVNYCLSNLLSGSPHPPPLPCVKVQYLQKVCVWEGVGGGVELCWRPYSAEFSTLHLTRFRTYKIARPPPNKNLERDLRQINTFRKVLLHIQKVYI